MARGKDSSQSGGVLEDGSLAFRSRVFCLTVLIWCSSRLFLFFSPNSEIVNQGILPGLGYDNIYNFKKKNQT